MEKLVTLLKLRELTKVVLNHIICQNMTKTKRTLVSSPGILKFRTQNRSGQPSDEVPPPHTQKKKKKKNVVAKTNDIVIYASRCITTFPELSKVLFHFILKKKPK